MRILADLHVHSRFSRATSPRLRPDYLDRWARIKGLDLVGTGDCTHPAYLAELRASLEESEGGFYRLLGAARRAFDAGAALAEGLPDPGAAPGPGTPRFAITGEISTIYSDRGRTRKVHHLVILPGLEAAAAFQARLERVGNVRSDGRPILGLSSRDLLELLLEADDRSMLVPAHVWTPWFSALGARSGYDSIDECYGDLAGRIGAIETGLSSNPPMNWAVASLDRFAIVSNSDAHSPDKLAREATELEMEDSYEGLRDALSGAEGGPAGRVAGTIEFFPQEGKYHYDGHRACGVALSPAESARSGGICPSCGRPLTPGVSGRVAELADRPVDELSPCPDGGGAGNRRPYRSLIPLAELLAEIVGTGPGSKRVAASYNALIEAAGSELALLDRLEPSEIERLGGPGPAGALLAEAIGRMRAGKVHLRPGFDGEYGEVRAFAPGEEISRSGQEALFAEAAKRRPGGGRDRAASGAMGAGDEGATAGAELSRPSDAGRESPASRVVSRVVSRPPEAGGRIGAVPAGPEADGERRAASKSSAEPARRFALDEAQLSALRHGAGPALVVAGPGSGKTAVLALRVARLVEAGAEPSSILALTFTNKAAGELRARIASSVGATRASAVTASTFHALCLSILRERFADAGLPEDFRVLGDEERAGFLDRASREGGGRGDRARARRRARGLGAYVEGRKRYLLLPGEDRPRLGAAAPSGLAELAAELGLGARDPGLDEAYAAYREALRAVGALDFDDLVAGTVRLLAARPAILEACRRRFAAILVDEYQDVNFAQYALVRLLASPEALTGGEREPGGTARSLFAIGDPNQSIYGFRGSDPRFVGRFSEDFPGAKTYRLTRSFRCAGPIMGAAGRLVGAELEGAAGGDGGAAVSLYRREYPSGASEAEGIAREIDRLIGGTRFFAIDSGVAADTEGGVIGASGGPRLEEGTGPASTGLRSLGECAVLLRAAALSGPIEKALDDHGIPYVAVGELPWWEEEPARSIVARLLDESRSLDPASALRRAEALVLEEGQESPSLLARKRGLVGEAAGRLASFAAPFARLGSFLDALALGSPVDGSAVSAERVSVMTIHAAKGLEFDHVFVPGLEEGLLPFTLFGEDSDGEERIGEEKRILYVAMTRARVGLRLSWARSREFRGRRLELPPSRFLDELEELVPMAESRPARRGRDPQLGLF